MSWELVYSISGVLFLPILLFAIIASIRVNFVIDRYHHVKASGGLTARELVKKIAAENQLQIRVEVAPEHTGDHYDPSEKVVRLTQEVIDNDSVSALAIAAHECGHALQDAENYAPLRMRNFVIRLSNFSSRLLTPLIIISVIASLLTFGMAAEFYFKWLLLGFCIVYGLSALVSFITLPTEFDASRRGEQMLEKMQLVENNEQRAAVGQVLRAAANTYVVAFALSLVYFLRYLSYFMLLFGKDRD